MNKKTWLFSVITALTLGTAWAVRGKFGHEQGAAWAGAIGGIVIVLLSGKKNWLQKIYTVALAAAIGWGMGGMISYGIVVGYGKATDFQNALYGLLMLFVIGGLYGFTGGGMLGLALANQQEKKVNWPKLIVEMTIGGFLTYGFLIAQLGWKMTPPRSEMWAACLGASLALLWFIYRNNFEAPLKVALYAMLGAGFGFASGNFLQTIIIAFNIPFSGWNVMEYSIGFWGGLAMAFGVFSSKWEEPAEIRVVKSTNSLISLLVVVLFIPLIVWQQTFTQERFVELTETLNWQNINSGAVVLRISALLLILSMSVIQLFQLLKSKEKSIGRKQVLIYFVLLFAVFIIFSDIRTGSYFRWQPFEQKLYWVNFAMIVFMVSKNNIFDWNPKNQKINYSGFAIAFSVAIFLIFFLTFIAINSHEKLNGSQQRFPTENSINP